MNKKDQLMWALQALAQPAAVQKNLFPDYVCVADELANDFSDALLNLKTELRSNDLEALMVLDNRLNEISGSHNAQYWTDEALEEKEMWDEVRRVAERLLNYFNWKNERPPLKPEERGKIYIRGK
jgi:hypothetical protein